MKTTKFGQKISHISVSTPNNFRSNYMHSFEVYPNTIPPEGA